MMDAVRCAVLMLCRHPQPADAIVLLCGEDMEYRAQMAFDLFVAGYAQDIIVSGGVHKPPRVVGADGQDGAYGILVGKGVASDRIIRETASQNTREQAVNVLAIARERGWKRLLIVASEWHLPRATLTFIQALRDDDAEDEIAIIPAPRGKIKWHEAPEGMTASRLDLLVTDMQKAEAYSLHVASFVDGLEYLEQWEKP